MLEFQPYSVPKNIQRALSDYIERGIPVGGFLYAVLSNDLFTAVNQTEDLTGLSEIVNWIYDRAPQACWGSEAKVIRWLQEHPERGNTIKLT